MRRTTSIVQNNGQDSEDAPEQRQTQHKKNWLDHLMDLAVAFHSASLASGGATVVTSSSNDSILTSEIFLNQAALAVFFSAVIFILLFFHLLSDYCTGRTSEEGCGRALARTMSGKKRQTVLSAAFSLIGGAMMFTQINGDRSKFVLAFSILAQLFSGVLIGPDAGKLPGRFGQFFQENGSLVRTDTMDQSFYRARDTSRTSGLTPSISATAPLADVHLRVPSPRLSSLRRDLPPNTVTSTSPTVSADPEPYGDGAFVLNIEEVTDGVHREPVSKGSQHNAVTFSAAAQP